MDWTQTLTFIGINLALVGVIATLVIAMNKLDSNTIDLCKKVNEYDQRMDQKYREILALLKENK